MTLYISSVYIKQEHIGPINVSMLLNGLIMITFMFHISYTIMSNILFKHIIHIGNNSHETLLVKEHSQSRKHKFY